MFTKTGFFMATFSGTTGGHCSASCVDLHTETPHDGLTDYSPKDAPWDRHRAQADDVGRIYAYAAEFERYAARMSRCSGVLAFSKTIEPETGEVALRLREAQFCRVRYCPVCQWRRALMWQAKFYKSLPKIVDAYPKARWMFLTLTVRNCAVTDLCDTLNAMNSAWQRLKDRKEFAPVLGWVRTTEVTRGKDGSAHPHFHALMMVPSSMLAGVNYVRQARWVELWQECGRLDYSPVVDIRAVKPRDLKHDNALTDATTALRGAVSETLKYAVKPADMIADPAWLLEMTRQLHKTRFVATGGVLKDALKDVLKDDAEDDVEGGDDGSRLAFSWRPSDKRYRRFAKADKRG